VESTPQPAMRLKDLIPFGMSVDEFAVVAGGVLIAGVLLWAALNFAPRNNVSKRVKMLNTRRAELKADLLAPKRRKSGHLKGHIHQMRDVVERFKLLKSKQSVVAQQLLLEAAWRSKDAMVIFAFCNLVTPIVGLIFGLIFLQFYDFTGKLVILNKTFPLFTLYFGMKLPTMVVKRRRKKRYYQIQRALSDTLDLMTICAEAGLSLGAALGRVSKELSMAYPEMASELALTALEMGFLPERNKALMNLAQRVNIEEMRGIVNVLLQTEKYGTPIAQALRVLSSEFRTQRMLRAENKAARLPAMMTVPMILFILPTLFIVVMSPAIIRAKDSWK
jgi:tight adherence protein C